MVDTRRIQVEGGFIQAVRIGIEVAYVCNLGYDSQCESLWAFFESLMGLRPKVRLGQSYSKLHKILFGEISEGRFVPFKL